MTGRVPSTVRVASCAADARSQPTNRRGASRNNGCCGAATWRTTDAAIAQRSSGSGVRTPIQSGPTRTRNPPDKETISARAANSSESTSSARAQRGKTCTRGGIRSVRGFTVRGTHENTRTREPQCSHLAVTCASAKPSRTSVLRAASASSPVANGPTTTWYQTPPPVLRVETGRPSAATVADTSAARRSVLKAATAISNEPDFAAAADGSGLACGGGGEGSCDGARSFGVAAGAATSGAGAAGAADRSAGSDGRAAGRPAHQ